MSEGDTIHHAARRIHAVLAGRTPDEILTPHPRHGPDRWPERLAGHAVAEVQARGKHLLVRFAGDLTLHSHLRMTGTWGVYERGHPWHRMAHKAWLVMRAGEWEVVQFDGPVLELMSERRIRSDRRLTELGPDVFGEDFEAALFLRRLRAEDPSRPIRDALLDQRILAGIGNVWKAEACFATALDPWRLAGEVSDEQALAVVSFIREYMARAAQAPAGNGVRPSAVYKRAGQRCLRCSSTVCARGQGENNRITYWCPGCQL
jgi:endonuclease VIII